jgi:hypothetical protein
MNGETPLDRAYTLVEAAKVPIELVAGLFELHQRQWDLEDASRSPTTDDSAIAWAKREIDASNARRHRLIDNIDANVVTRLTSPVPMLYSETVGELCDRLLILHVKLVRLLENAAVHGNDERLPRLVATAAHLGATVDQLIGSLHAGRASLPPRAGIKIYKFERDGADVQSGC